MSERTIPDWIDIATDRLRLIALCRMGEYHLSELVPWQLAEPSRADWLSRFRQTVLDDCTASGAEKLPSESRAFQDFARLCHGVEGKPIRELSYIIEERAVTAFHVLSDVVHSHSREIATFTGLSFAHLDQVLARILQTTASPEDRGAALSELGRLLQCVAVAAKEGIPEPSRSGEPKPGDEIVTLPAAAKLGASGQYVSLREIADYTGASPTSVERELTRRGIKPARWGRALNSPRRYLLEHVVPLLREGNFRV